MKHDDHTPEGHSAIEAELVRLTLGGAMTRADMWLPMDLSGRLARMTFALDAVQDLADAMRPVFESVSGSMARLTAVAKRMSEEATQ